MKKYKKFKKSINTLITASLIASLTFSSAGCKVRVEKKENGNVNSSSDSSTNNNTSSSNNQNKENLNTKEAETNKEAQNQGASSNQNAADNNSENNSVDTNNEPNEASTENNVETSVEKHLLLEYNTQMDVNKFFEALDLAKARGIQKSDRIYLVKLHKYQNQEFVGFYGYGSDSTINGFFDLTTTAKQDYVFELGRFFSFEAVYDSQANTLTIDNLKTNRNTYYQVIDLNQIDCSSVNSNNQNTDNSNTQANPNESSAGNATNNETSPNNSTDTFAPTTNETGEATKPTENSDTNSNQNSNPVQNQPNNSSNTSNNSTSNPENNETRADNEHSNTIQEKALLVYNTTKSGDKFKAALEKHINKWAEKISDNKYKIRLHKYKNQEFIGFYGGGASEEQNGFFNFTELGKEDPDFAKSKYLSIYSIYDSQKNIITIENFTTSANTYNQVIDLNPILVNESSLETSNEPASSKENEPSREVTPNEPKVDATTESETIYVRPPFGARFEFVNQSLNLPGIITIFDHLDSPGKRKEEPSPNISVRSQGAQEVSEFLSLPKVMKYYLEAGNENDFVIFGGDTNIKSENFDLQNHSNFSGVDATLTGLWTNSLSPENNYVTSLGNNSNYSEPYDKMFFVNNTPGLIGVKQIVDSNFEATRFKVDIINGFYNGIWNKKQLVDSIEDNGRFKHYKSDDKTDFQIIKYVISDHAPVYTDLKILNNELETNPSTLEINPKEKNVLRIAHWNILNFAHHNAKSLAIAGLIWKSGIDIIGLTEINKNRGEQVYEIVSRLNKLSGRNFQCIIQNVEDVEVPEAYLNKYSWIGRGQEEQIAIIYDADLVRPSGFPDNNNVESFSYRKTIPFLGDI
ncbi:MnuA family membrane nuclease [Mycoplasmopsis glycophila]|uniref:Uncharacterized protein n=1 Tax=Mycoplasmopsis glycophila TaxID=171285 RepID=A0A449AVH8_9BACT|nr:hypothetical protein [Mycoplasmopsis glycophila]VEU70508.1 Uncharacterised protein [Mycoplasmopsis glycophila]